MAKFLLFHAGRITTCLGSGIPDLGSTRGQAVCAHPSTPQWVGPPVYLVFYVAFVDLNRCPHSLPASTLTYWAIPRVSLIDAFSNKMVKCMPFYTWLLLFTMWSTFIYATDCNSISVLFIVGKHYSILKHMSIQKLADTCSYTDVSSSHYS